MLSKATIKIPVFEIVTVSLEFEIKIIFAVSLILILL